MEPLSMYTAVIEAKKPLKLRLISTVDPSKVVYVSTLGTVIPKVIPVVRLDNNYIKVVWEDQLSLNITHSELKKGHRYDVTWEALSPKILNLTDTVSLENANWYGGAQIKEQTWPIQEWTQKLAPYVAMNSFDGQWGGVMERYWLSSNGVAVFVDYEVPLSVGFAKKTLTLQSKWVAPYNNIDTRPLKLQYSIIQADNVKDTHMLVVNTFFAKPENIPNELMFRFPIWSTWAKYKTKINQDTVIAFAKEITDHEFPSCQIDIDDDWTTAYGDLMFDLKRFPDPGSMVKQLGELGHRTTLWVHPFASPFSKAVKNESYWVGSKLPTNTGTWWNGAGKSLDVTNDDAVAWYKKNLQDLRDRYGVTSFKFDAGEINWLPASFTTNEPMANPTDYTIKYAQLAYDMDREGRNQEVRVGARTQNLPVFVRMMDKDSDWDYKNGLKTIIPHALTFSLLGYPFILPDMIGGNNYSSVMGITLPPSFFGGAKLPEKELYIRWLQVNVFLPCMQFSIAPWQYDEEVVNIAKNMVKLHEEFANAMIGLARDCVKNGEPIIRPLWWVAPNDPETHTIDSQFLVGNDILVAPILEKGATARNIYLPPGRWRDMIHDQVLEGGRWENDFPADLDELPYFTRD